MDSHGEELDINNGVKQSLTNGFCQNHQTQLSECRLTTGNEQPWEKVLTSCQEYSHSHHTSSLETLVCILLETLPEEIVTKVGI